MQIAICDDEKVFLQSLEEKIYSVISSLDCDVIPFSSADQLLEADKKFDIIFLDIEMEGTDGMTAARMIRRTDPDTPIVFLTSHTELAPDGYEVNAFRFLKKPVDDDKLKQTLEDLKLMKADQRGMLIKSGGEDILIAPAEVYYIESDNNNVRLHTAAGTLTTRMKLKEIIESINSVSNCLFQIHRCCAVNLSHVARIRDKEAVLDDGSVTGISRSYLGEFKKALYDHVRRTAR